VAGDERLTVYRMQFHAEREELIAYIAGWVGWDGLSVVAERFFPEYEPVAIPPSVGTGSQRYFASHRHTPGAHELACGGVRMLACAGDTSFEFADVEVHDEQLAC
jgi:hypothetical protein